MYPDGMDSKFVPIYSGKVLIKGDNGERLSVPYMGKAHDRCARDHWLTVGQVLAAI